MVSIVRIGNAAFDAAALAAYTAWNNAMQAAQNIVPLVWAADVAYFQALVSASEAFNGGANVAVFLEALQELAMRRPTLPIQIQPTWLIDGNGNGLIDQNGLALTA